MEVPLDEYHYEENKNSFLESVNKYSKKWYDYDLEIIDIIKKEKYNCSTLSMGRV